MWVQIPMSNTYHHRPQGWILQIFAMSVSMFCHVQLRGQWALLQRYRVPPCKGNSHICVWGLFFCLFLLKVLGSNTICITCQHIGQWHCQNNTAKEKKTRAIPSPHQLISYQGRGGAEDGEDIIIKLLWQLGLWGVFIVCACVFWRDNIGEGRWTR